MLSTAAALPDNGMLMVSGDGAADRDAGRLVDVGDADTAAVDQTLNVRNANLCAVSLT